MNRQRNESESEGKKLHWGKKINVTASFSLRSHFFIPLCQHVSGFLFLCGSASWCASQCRKEQTFFFFFLFQCLRVLCQGNFGSFLFHTMIPRSPLSRVNKMHLCAREGRRSEGTGDVRARSVCMCEWLSAGSINQQSGNQSQRLLTSSSPNKLQHGKRVLVPGQRDPTVPESIIHNKHSIFQINYTPGPNLSSFFSGGHCGTAPSDFALTRFIWVMLILCLLLCFVHPACFLAFISASCSPCLCLQLYTDWNGTVLSFCLPCPLWYLYYCIFHYNNCFQVTLCRGHV